MPTGIFRSTSVQHPGQHPRCLQMQASTPAPPGVATIGGCPLCGRSVAVGRGSDRGDPCPYTAHPSHGDRWRAVRPELALQDLTILS